MYGVPPRMQEDVLEGHRRVLLQLLERITIIEDRVRQMMVHNDGRLGYQLLQSQLDHLAWEAQAIEDEIEQGGLAQLEDPET